MDIFTGSIEKCLLKLNSTHTGIENNLNNNILGYINEIVININSNYHLEGRIGEHQEFNKNGLTNFARTIKGSMDSLFHDNTRSNKTDVCDLLNKLNWGFFIGGMDYTTYPIAEEITISSIDDIGLYLHCILSNENIKYISCQMLLSYIPDDKTIESLSQIGWRVIDYDLSWEYKIY